MFFTRSYPTLTDWINDVLGTSLDLPIQSFGFFVALAFIAGAIASTYELKRKERQGLIFPRTTKKLIGKPASTGDIVLNVVIGFFLGFKILAMLLSWSSCNENPVGFIFSLDGNLLGGIIGGIVAGYIKYREKEKKKLDKPKYEEVKIYPHQRVGDILIIAAVSGFIGAKIFNFLEDPDDFVRFLQDPAANMFSGLTMYGGLIFGASAVLFYVYKKGINIVHFLDAVTPSLMLAYGVGRLGCHVAGDGDWGIANVYDKPGWLTWLPDKLWAYSYPHNIINRGEFIPGCEELHCYELVPAVFPTPIYEFVMAVVIFAILIGLSRKLLIFPGAILASYVFLNGLQRFTIEKIRVNVVYDLFGMQVTQAEIISTMFMIAGIGLFVFFYRKAKKDDKALNGR